MAKRRSPLSPRLVEADAEPRRHARPARGRDDRTRAARLGTEGDTLPGAQLTRSQQQALRTVTLLARAAADRMAVELREARADQHRSDVARAQAIVALAQLHERYAAALDRLRGADVRLAVLEAQNGLLRLHLGRGGDHG
ncbi:hypothetical protein MMSR116_05945 [Methylobacterium mesophilicum SR1.6/6]|uniref:Uncharacterized protein n=1 Tax=Methylobacterium mesophilicum SR1.6/6 TaxID=908290 RepID=A0A6B9FK25_9HYPH|nr:hypothetical protein [Methylobacterium mesophilicum]QGY01495.1 hypothetical protein MMSR116_05945 [Methylobacterium mesophilicum SR1.6/6]